MAIKIWDTSLSNKDINITVDKAVFRDKWLKYYLAIQELEEATAQKLKDNVSEVIVGSTNHVSNGNFAIDLTKSLWKDSYIGQVKEVVDISTERPPFQFAYHVKNTTNANGGIFLPVLWDGNIAESLVDKEITISFWLKYQNITQGANAWNLGRFGELVVEGEVSGGSKVYRYPRVHVDNTSTETLYFSGTNMTWKKYSATLKLNLPSTAYKLTNIQFKFGLEGCTGEFWTTGMQAEFGNVVTDWSPNPLDVQDRLVNVEFKVLPESIVSTVTESQEYVDLSNKVITGGRNYVLNSNFSRELRNWYPYEYYVDGENQVDEESLFGDSDEIEVVFETLFGQDGEDFNSSVIPQTENSKTFLKIKCNDDSKFQSIYQPIRLENGKNYTISFKAFKKGNNYPSVYVDFYYGNVLLTQNNIVITETIQELSFTFNNTNVNEDNKLELWTMTYDDELYITDIKIEEGITKTNWCPAIEDGEVDFLNLNRVSTEFKSQINQTSRKIELLVGADDKIKGESIVSAISILPSNIQIDTKNLNLNGMLTIANAGGNPNMIKNGFDSFAQVPYNDALNSLPSPMTLRSGISTRGGIYRWGGLDGGNKLILQGSAVNTTFRFNNQSDAEYGAMHIISFYWLANTGNTLSVSVVDSNGTAYPLKAQPDTYLGNGWQRYSASFSLNSWSLDFDLILGNTGVDYSFDCFMLEKAVSGQTEPSPWKPASTTTINGDLIRTGTIDASVVNVTNINANNITAGSISADRINGGTITGITIRTASSGRRVEMVGTSLYSYGDNGGWARFDNGQINVHQNGGSADILAGLIWLSNDTYGTLELAHDPSYGGTYIKATSTINALGSWSFASATVTGLYAKFG